MFFSDIELARRVEDANAITNAKYAEAHAQLYPDSDASVLAIGGGQAIYMGPTSPLTQVLGFGLHNSITLSEIEEIENFYFSKNTPVNIELCPLVETCLLENLANRNYKLIEVSNVLVKQLGKNILPISAIPNIKIEKISQNKAKIWVNVMSKGFSEFPEAAGMLENMWLTGFEVPNNHYFLASTNADEIPAGAASISIYNGVASLCGASTLPEFRKLGIQTTLLQHRFNLAIEQNCDLATISTLPGTISQRNAERQGFQVIYTRVKLMRSKS